MSSEHGGNLSSLETFVDGVGVDWVEVVVELTVPALMLGIEAATPELS